jgi:hypothetical protein
LLLAGIAVALFAAHAPSQTILGTRQTAISDALNALRHGGPLLTGHPATGPYAGEFYRFYWTDAGIYIYLPLLGELFNQSNPNVLMTWFFLVALALPLVIYPLVFAELLDSAALGLLAPILLLLKIAFIRFADIYWMYVWSPVVALPLLMLIYKRWSSRWCTAGVLGIMLLASFCNTVRAQSGLPVLLAALLLLVLVTGSLRRKLLLAVVCILCYISVTPGLFGAIQAYRDHELHSRAYRTRVVNLEDDQTDGFWHSTYIGLAFEPNRHGIYEFNDSLAADYVSRVNPRASFLSPAYEAVLRKRFFYLLGHDPGFVVKAEASKALLTADDGIINNKLLPLLLPPLLLLGARRRFVRVCLSFVAPGVLVLAVPPIASIPFGFRPLLGYELGVLGILAFTSVLAVLFALRYGLDKLLAWPGDRGVATMVSGLRPAALPVLGSVIAAIAVHVGAAGARANRSYLNNASVIELQPVRTVSDIVHWTFRRGTPPGWMASPGLSAVSVQNGVSVHTNPTGRPQLVSAGVRLMPGSYRMLVTGSVLAGGIDVGIFDRVGNTLMIRGRFWRGQTADHPRVLPVDLEVTSPTTVDIRLANWGTQRSRWLIQAVSLRHVKRATGA